MKPSYLLVFVLLLLVAVSPRAHGQEPAADPTFIRLQATTFDPLTTNEPLITAAAAGVVSPYYLVQFAGPVEAVWVQQITALGGRVLGYIPDNTHIVRLNADAIANVRSLPGVRWVGPYQPAYKLAPDLALNAANAGATPLELMLVAFADADPATITAALQRQGATVQESARYDWGLVFRLSAPATALAAISQQPAIAWVERYIEPQLANAEGRKLMGVEAVWQNYGYFGNGQIIAISDSGLSVQGNLTPDFDTRLVRAFAPSEMNLSSPQCMAKTTWTDLNGHGTHVAGSVLGNGTRSGSNAATHAYTGSHAGAAPEAQLVFMALNTDGSTGIQCIDLNGDFVAKGYQAGARISSNSWGANDGGGYNLIASLVDDYIWRHKDYLVLYAAGNAGAGARTVGSPGTAKNVLTVGASENNRPDKDDESDNPNTMAGFSSRGPTADGRIKPDLVAPGTWILSVKGAQAPDGSFWGPFNADYAFMGGTSMATPLTAGAAALVREWLGKERGVTNPSAALMKAILMNGATQLPGEPTPSNNSGSGRVDLKNTLSAHYAVIDDFVQGLTTGQRVTYTVQIVATTALGNLLAANPTPVGAGTVQAAGQSLQLTESTPPLATATVVTDTRALQGEPLPGFATARQQTAIPTLSGSSKNGLAPLTNPAPSIGAGTAPGGVDANMQRFQPHTADTPPSVFSYRQNMIGGGDFEDPDWSDYWYEVWLGSGVPVRTDDPSYVINGFYSMWLGGTPSDDALYYPVQFPDQIDGDFPSGIAFNVAIIDQDLDEEGTPFDQLCVALMDASGNLIGPYAPDSPECVGEDGDYTYTLTFSTADKANLAGATAYLVVYTYGDAAEPHMSAFVDDIELVVDFPDVTASTIPSSGPPGSKFLLVGQYNVPYGWVDICLNPCNNDTYIKTAYADARGDIAIFLYTTDTIEPGVYTIQTANLAGRTATTTITILGDATPSLTITPNTGPAGTKFQVNGSNFLPNDTAIAVTIAGQAFGTVGSNAAGEVSFTIQTTTNTPAGDYALQATDSGGRSATATFAVTAVASGDPTLTVTPAAGPPGTTFTFDAANFTPSTPADVLLDGKTIGQINIDTTGGAKLTLDTKTDTGPGQYTLAVSQGQKQATAQYEVTSGGTNPQTGSGLYITLVWSDPPAQAAATQTLINDLDLTVTGPGGQLLGNGGTTPDRKNNVETVRLENPTAGTYVISVQAQRVNATFGSQPFALVATTKQNFDAGTNSVNLGQANAGRVNGLVFADVNHNGVQDAGEVGVGNVTVLIQQVNGSLSRQTTTDASGAYDLSNLPVGDYTITVVLPSGYTVTTNATLSLQVATGSTTAPAIGAVTQLFLPLALR